MSLSARERVGKNNGRKVRWRDRFAMWQKEN
jgi:hypothetical protein